LYFLIVLLIIFIAGIDWHDVKKRGIQRKFPFNVPAGLLERAPGELDYHYDLLQRERVKKEALGLIEDVEINGLLLQFYITVLLLH